MTHGQKTSWDQSVQFRCLRTLWTCSGVWKDGTPKHDRYLVLTWPRSVGRASGRINNEFPPGPETLTKKKRKVKLDRVDNCVLLHFGAFVFLLNIYYTPLMDITGWSRLITIIKRVQRITDKAITTNSTSLLILSRVHNFRSSTWYTHYTAVVVKIGFYMTTPSAIRLLRNF